MNAATSQQIAALSKCRTRAPGARSAVKRGDHGQDEQDIRGDKEGEWFLEKIRPAAVPEDDANRDSERDQGKTGDKNNVQRTHGRRVKTPPPRTRARSR